MAELVVGSVQMSLPYDIELDPRAGKLDRKDVVRMEKARSSVTKACMRTGAALNEAGDRVVVPGVSSVDLVQAGQRAAALDQVKNNLQTALLIVSQQDLIEGEKAHLLLRRVLASVRAAEKFDARVTQLFPDLIAYFENDQASKKAV